MSKLRAKTSPAFSVRFRDTLISKNESFNVSAFTKIEPIYRDVLDSQLGNIYPQLRSQLSKIYLVFRSEFGSILNGEKSIEDALYEVETKGNQVLIGLSKD